MDRQFQLDDLKYASITDLALVIKRDWQNVYFAAKPYLEAMLTMINIDDKYCCEDGRSIVLYFLSNASSWRGIAAREIKAELKRRLK